MAQSLKLGGAANSQATAGIERVNRLPIILVILFLVAFSASFSMGLRRAGSTSARITVQTPARAIRPRPMPTRSSGGSPTASLPSHSRSRRSSRGRSRPKRPTRRRPIPLRRSPSRDSSGGNRNWSRKRCGGHVLPLSNSERFSARSNASGWPGCKRETPPMTRRWRSTAGSWKRGRKKMTAPELGRRQPQAQTVPIFMPQPCAPVWAGRTSTQTGRAPRKTSSMPILRISAICRTASCRSSPYTHCNEARLFRRH